MCSPLGRSNISDIDISDFVIVERDPKNEKLKQFGILMFNNITKSVQQTKQNEGPKKPTPPPIPSRVGRGPLTNKTTQEGNKVLRPQAANRKLPELPLSFYTKQNGKIKTNDLGSFRQSIEKIYSKIPNTTKKATSNTIKLFYNTCIDDTIIERDALQKQFAKIQDQSFKSQNQLTELHNKVDESYNLINQAINKITVIKNKIAKLLKKIDIIEKSLPNVSMETKIHSMVAMNKMTDEVVDLKVQLMQEDSALSNRDFKLNEIGSEIIDFEFELVDKESKQKEIESELKLVQNKLIEKEVELIALIDIFDKDQIKGSLVEKHPEAHQFVNSALDLLSRALDAFPDAKFEDILDAAKPIADLIYSSETPNAQAIVISRLLAKHRAAIQR